MKIKYNLYNGIPAYTVTLSSVNNTYVNNHIAQGAYEFNNVANGAYELVAVDSTGCEFEFGEIVVDNDKFYLYSSQTQNTTNSQTIGTIDIKSLTRKYKLLINPNFNVGSTATLQVGYQLITDETPVDQFDDVYSIASVEVLKDNVVVDQQQVNSNGISGATGTFTITGIQSETLVSFTSSIIVRSKPSENKFTSGFFEIYVISLNLDGSPVSINTNSFNINGNLT
jgi:hypothetical protein